MESNDTMNHANSTCRSSPGWLWFAQRTTADRGGPSGNPSHPARRAGRKRRGAILIAALVCLAIVMALLGSMLASAIRTGRQLHAERDLRQCELLLAAGIDRAMLRLAKEPDYRGETWQLPAAEIVASGAGVVTINVAVDSTQQPWPLSVIAEYPAGSERSVRRSRTILLPSKPSLE